MTEESLFTLVLQHDLFFRRVGLVTIREVCEHAGRSADAVMLARLATLPQSNLASREWHWHWQAACIFTSPFPEPTSARLPGAGSDQKRALSSASGVVGLKGLFGFCRSPFFALVSRSSGTLSEALCVAFSPLRESALRRIESSHKRP